MRISVAKAMNLGEAGFDSYYLFLLFLMVVDESDAREVSGTSEVPDAT